MATKILWYEKGDMTAEKNMRIRKRVVERGRANRTARAEEDFFRVFKTTPEKFMKMNSIRPKTKDVLPSGEIILAQSSLYKISIVGDSILLEYMPTGDAVVCEKNENNMEGLYQLFLKMAEMPSYKLFPVTKRRL